MSLSLFQKITLGISGFTALGIGLSILAFPHGFYAGYGITLGGDISLLSELRAPAAGLSALGAIMITGILRDSWRETSIIAALTVFLAFPAGRMIGLVLDGIPSASILGALVFELIIAVLCVTAFGRYLWRGKSQNSKTWFTQT